MEIIEGPAPRPGPRPAPRSSGFSLIEAVFAALLLALSVSALVRAISASSNAGRSAADAALAVRIARARLDRLQSAPLSRRWPLTGYRAAMTPGGSVAITGSGAPGYVEYFDEDGAPAGPESALYEVRWRVSELVAAGQDRLASVRFEVVALPTSGGRGAIVRLQSVRVANRE